MITAVALAPGGAHPSYAHGYYDRDNAFYLGVGPDQPRPRAVHAWMRRHVLETADVGIEPALAERRARTPPTR